MLNVVVDKVFFWYLKWFLLCVIMNRTKMPELGNAWEG